MYSFQKIKMLQPFDVLLPMLVAELRQLSNGKSRQLLSLAEALDVKYFPPYLLAF
jgi:hypothetical protein